MTSLRDEQKQIARNRILEALAAEIIEHGLLDLSIPAVAERAEVSQRTVYNYFENKDALVRSLYQRAEQWMVDRGGRDVEPDIELIPQALEINFSLFTEMGDVTAALARIRTELHRDHELDASAGRGHERRTEALRTGLAEVRPDLEPDELAAVTAIFRLMFRFETWDYLTNDFGLSGTDAGKVSAWAFSVLLDALKNDKGPFDLRNQDEIRRGNEKP